MTSSTHGRRRQEDDTLPEGGRPEVAEVPEANLETLRPGQCRSFTRKEVARAMPAIVKSFVKEAGKGSVPHLNLLTKIGGFDQRAVAAPLKRRGKSATRRLLDDLRAHQAKAIARNEARLAAERPASDSAQ